MVSAKRDNVALVPESQDIEISQNLVKPSRVEKNLKRKLYRYHKKKLAEQQVTAESKETEPRQESALKLKRNPVKKPNTEENDQIALTKAPSDEPIALNEQQSSAKPKFSPRRDGLDSQNTENKEIAGYKPKSCRKTLPKKGKWQAVKEAVPRLNKRLSKKIEATVLQSLPAI